MSTTPDHALIEFEGEEPDDGWSKVPHGLWTCGLDPRAAMLLGWLHSHHPHYRRRLSTARIRTEFGSGGSTSRLLNQLAEHGFLRIIPPENPGGPTRFVVSIAAYHALRRSDSRVAHDGSPGVAHDGLPPQPTTGYPPSPRRATREDHVEEQGEEHSLVPVVSVPVRAPSGAQVLAAGFGWFWTRYPRKVAKPQAEKAYVKAVARSSHEAIMQGVERWLPAWAANDPKFIPHPATWLNRDGWNDEPVASRPGRHGGLSSTAAMAQRDLQRRHGMEVE